MRTVSFLFPGKLVFGSDAYAILQEDMRGAGYSRLYIVSTRSMGHEAKALAHALDSAGMDCRVDVSTQSEPTFDEFEALLEDVRSFDPDCVVGLGGGSAMDLAKLLAAQSRNRQSTEEVKGIGNLSERKTALICLPTTSGTGSEVSPNALFTDEDGSKVGVISPHLVPDAAYVYPEFTLSVPPEVTAATGIDALTHCLEAFANRFAHPIASTLAKEGVRLISANLIAACRNGDDLHARTALALGSVYGGMCLGPVNTGAVHALAYPLGTEFHIAHGLCNALVLPEVMDFNLPCAVSEYAELAAALGVKQGCSDEETAKTGIGRIRELIAECRIPSRLSQVEIPWEAIDSLAEGALKVQRLLKNNLREVTLADAKAMYRAAY